MALDLLIVCDLVFVPRQQEHSILLQVSFTLLAEPSARLTLTSLSDLGLVGR